MYLFFGSTRICQGCYDPELVRSWEDWDALITSESDHPSIFPNHQVSSVSLPITLLRILDCIRNILETYPKCIIIISTFEQRVQPQLQSY